MGFLALLIGNPEPLTPTHPRGMWISCSCLGLPVQSQLLSREGHGSRRVGGNREAQRPLSWAEQMEMTEPAPHSLGDAKPPRCCSVPPIQATTGPISAQV